MRCSSSSSGSGGRSSGGGGGGRPGLQPVSHVDVAAACAVYCVNHLGPTVWTLGEADGCMYRHGGYGHGCVLGGELRLGDIHEIIFIHACIMLSVPMRYSIRHTCTHERTPHVPAGSTPVSRMPTTTPLPSKVGCCCRKAAWCVCVGRRMGKLEPINCPLVNYTTHHRICVHVTSRSDAEAHNMRVGLVWCRTCTYDLTFAIWDKIIGHAISLLSAVSSTMSKRLEISRKSPLKSWLCTHSKHTKGPTWGKISVGRKSGLFVETRRQHHV